MPTDDTDDRGAVAAQLQDVFFSYDRDVELPTEGEMDDPTEIDPDARGGIVLQGVDMEVPNGSFTVVMGASGGGKSTLVRTLNAIIPSFLRGRFRGEVTVLGRDATDTRTSEMADRVGMVFQDYESQLFGTSVETEVAFGLENLAVPPESMGDRIDRALSTAGLADIDRRREPAGLSGGQKQRLVLASVLAMHPELLVLDEPTSDLDPRGTRDLVDAIAALTGMGSESTATDDRRDENGTEDRAVSADVRVSESPETIVMVTHKIEEALLADRGVLLRNGRVFRSGPIRGVFTDVDALRACRVAVPPLVETFERIGWSTDDLPLLPDDARERVRSSDLAWEPPARRGEPLPGVPAGTGERVGDPLFELRDVVHEYETERESIRAIDGVDLTIREGDVVAIAGHNGSGKTTLAKHLNGLLDPDSGTVTFRGRDVPDLRMSEIGQDVGFVFQNPDHQLFASTVREEVTFGPKNFGVTGEELERRVSQAIETVELESLADADPFNLSKGQRQRVALASVFATDPDVIIFDEPTTGLDAAQQERFMGFVAELNREEDMTVVMVTHDMSTVARYAPRTVVLRDGRIEQDQPTREFFADESALKGWDLTPPHPVALSNRLAADAGTDDALPALSVDELVTGLGGDGALKDEGAPP